MDEFLLPLAFATGLIAGPFIVAKVWPERSRCIGTAAAGECGVAPLYWGLALGCGIGYVALSALIATTADELASPATKAVLIAMMFAFMGALVAPLIIFGFHSWKWDESGVEFTGFFHRRTILWKNLSTARRGTTWKLTAVDGTTLSISSYVRGERLIIGALCTNRPDLAQQITGALEAERA